MIIDLLLPILFLCWGSFLNVLGTRLISGESLLNRSHCNACTTQIKWYDLIPVISWLWLRGRCRTCSTAISLLYPCIELFTAAILMLTYYTVLPIYFPAYFVFFSALIVTIRSDLETMFISQYVTLFLIPLALMLAAIDMLPLSMLESACGALFGYALLYLPAKLFLALTKKEGIGLGDADLLAFIGAFLGITGVWMVLLIGSLAGSIIGIAYLIIKKADRNTRIPFGPFLALGAMITALYGDQMIEWMIGF